MRDLQDRTARGFFQSNRALLLAWCVVALYLVLTFVLIEGRQPTWEDELYVQSTAWSIVHGGPAMLSTISQYPHRAPLDHFYGPVSFRVAAGLIRIFGLKTWPWRLVCFLLGITVIVAASAALLRLTGARGWKLLLAAALLVTSCTYCNVLPGRWDPMTVGLLLSDIAFLLNAIEQHWVGLFVRSVAAGICFGLAAGSTPRSLPALAAALCGIAAAVWLDARKRKPILVAGIVAAISGFATDALLLAPLGMNPWSWLQFVRVTSQGDRVNSSPLFGGQWDLGISSHKLLIILVIIIMMAGVVSAWEPRRERADPQKTWRLTLTIIGVVNFALYALLISRVLSYALFWLPMLIVSAFSWIRLDQIQGPWARRAVASMVILGTLLTVTLEGKRIFDAVRSWKGSDPAILIDVVREQIPPGSVVFGPIGGYFFPVEQSCSQYLYMQDDILQGLSYGVDSPEYRTQYIDRFACQRPTFIIWPATDSDEEIPEEVLAHAQRIDGREKAQRIDNTIIYRIEKPNNCSDTGGSK